MFSFIRNLFSTTKEKTEKTEILTSFGLFQASPKFLQFQQEYPGIDFNQPVELDQLIKDEQYLIVYVIYCWDNICFQDHHCRLDFGITNRFVFKGIENNIYEFLEDPENGESVFRTYSSEYIKNENASKFIYSLNHTHFIK